MSCFGASLVQPSAASQDPTKHVSYQLGMVLGVDDLNQEFSYHAERLRWTTRDLLGYGTAWGLAVSVRDAGAPRGPEIVVTSGVGVSPRGQLIRVAPTQCAGLNDWLAARTDDVIKRRVPTGSPNVFDVPLYLVLSYRPCLTDPVPIAGEPCRSEGDSTKPSRVADDFLLELAFDPPPQEEEDATREFVQWLRTHVTVTSAGPASLTIGAFLDRIRAAADAAAAPTVSPPSGPAPVLVETSPPTQLAVPAAQLGAYLRAALALWVTELRPRWRPSWLGDKHGCACGGVLAATDQGNQLLLAALTVPVVAPGLGASGFTVTSAADVVISQEARPILIATRMLQELLDATGTGAAPPGSVGVVAAGVVQADGATATTRAAVGNLRLQAVVANTGSATSLRFTFDGYVQPPTTGGPQYLVKAMAWPLAAINLSVTFAGFQANGFVLLVSNAGAALGTDLPKLQMMVEVSQYP